MLTPRQRVLLGLAALTAVAGGRPGSSALGDRPEDVLSAAQAAIELRNGRWYDGSSFQDRVYYVVGGLLSADRPDSVMEVLDLGGGYVIPPFGDAHNHRPDGWPGTDRHVAQFLEHGIFYVMNPNSFPSRTRGIANEVNRPESVDVIFANGGLTPPGSHVVELYQRNWDRGVFPDDYPRERLEGDGYYVVDDARDLDEKWPAVLAGRPDFIKVFLAFSEDYRLRRDDPDFVGKRGIDPALVPDIVERAHLAGLRVAAHIETAEDFRVAVSAGADIIAHMPASWRVGEAAGYPDGAIDRWLLVESDGAEAARRGTAVVAHVSYGFANADVARIHAHNLALLKRHGVTLAIGSDSYDRTALRDAVYLQSTGLFTAAEVLDIASGSTLRTIFPGRRIGRLADGYEASFLVIDGDPIRRPLFDTPTDSEDEAIESVTARIRLRVKEGHVLDE